MPRILKEPNEPTEQDTNPVLSGRMPPSIIKDVVSLLSSPNLTPLSDYPALHDLVAEMLEHGWRDIEIQSALLIAAMDLSVLRARSCLADPSWWKRHEDASLKWNGARRARLLTRPNAHDMAILGVKEPEYAPKRVELPEGTTFNILMFPSDKGKLVPSESMRKVIDADVNAKKDE